MIPNISGVPKQQVIELLRSKEILRFREVLRSLSPKDKPKAQKFSSLTIKRAIKDLEREGVLIKVKQKQLQEYGIIERDKRAVYLTLKEDENELELMKRSIALLDSKDKFTLKIALEELKGKISVRLKQPQIDKIVLILKNKSSEWDDELCCILLKILSESVKRGVIPSIDYFGSLTNLLYEDYNSFSCQELKGNKKELVSIIIKLLALLEDKRIIDIIKNLIKNSILNEFYEVFSNWEVSKIIIKYDLELFNLQVANKKNETIVFLIREIREKGLSAYRDYKGNLSRSENAIKQVLSNSKREEDITKKVV